MTLKIDEKYIAVYGDILAENIIIKLTGIHENGESEMLYETVKTLTDKPFCIVTYPVADWNDELSPWPAPAVFGDEAFGDGAELLLKEILQRLIPEIDAQRSGKSCRYYIAGYSLAGLFSLWSGYRTEVFYGVAAVSPSVWFPGWLDYAGNHRPGFKELYLSLGRKEEKTRNPVMATVGECIRTQYELCNGVEPAGSVGCILEWNEGNHFKDPGLRVAKGIAWLLNKGGLT